MSELPDLSRASQHRKPAASVPRGRAPASVGGTGPKRRCNRMSMCIWLTVMAAASCINQDIVADIGALGDTGHLDMVEACAPKDSGLVQAIREDGRQGTRLSIWNGFGFATSDTQQNTEQKA